MGLIMMFVYRTFMRSHSNVFLFHKISEMGKILLFTFTYVWLKTCINNILDPDQKHCGRAMIWYKHVFLVETLSDNLWELALCWWVFTFFCLHNLHSWWCGEKPYCMSCLNQFMLPGSQWCTALWWILMKLSVVPAVSFWQCRIFNIFLESSLCQNFCIRTAVQSSQSLQDTRVLVVSTRRVRSDNPSNFFLSWNPWTGIDLSYYLWKFRVQSPA